MQSHFSAYPNFWGLHKPDPNIDHRRVPNLQVFLTRNGTELTVNVLGSAVLGVLAGLMAFLWSPSPELRAFLVVGILGALTTFSTFSLDVVLLIERGEWAPAGIYSVVSVVLSVGALMAGLAAVRSLAA